MNGNTKVSPRSTQRVLNANPQSEYLKMESQINPKTNNTVDTFYGFWKYLGVMGSFFIGIALTWWGVNIFLNDWIEIRTLAGPMGNLVLTPLVMGVALCWFSFAEFLRIIKEK